MTQFNATEVYLFSGTQYLLQFVRFLLILYFILQAVRYARLRSKIEKDNLTLATFVLMIISSVIFLISGIGIITLHMLTRVLGPENEWVKNNVRRINVMEAIMRTGFAFLA
jgi:uncharacterized protein with PQ loop repeat